jgi:hypothetical protein
LTSRELKKTANYFAQNDPVHKPARQKRAAATNNPLSAAQNCPAGLDLNREPR